MTKFLTRDDVQLIVQQTRKTMTLMPPQIDALCNDLNSVLAKMGGFTGLEGVGPNQAERTRTKLKRALLQVKSEPEISKPLLRSLLFRKLLPVRDDPPSVISRDAIEISEVFFLAVDLMLMVLGATRRDEVKYSLPAFHKPNQLLLELPKIYEKHFNEQCGIGEGPGTRFIVAVLNAAAVKNQDGNEFKPSGVIKLRARSKAPKAKV
jgi:hypothetical protein